MVFFTKLQYVLLSFIVTFFIFEIKQKTIVYFIIKPLFFYGRPIKENVIVNDIISTLFLIILYSSIFSVLICFPYIFFTFFTFFFPIQHKHQAILFIFQSSVFIIILYLSLLFSHYFFSSKFWEFFINNYNNVTKGAPSNGSFH